MAPEHVDVVVAGGGPAGASAAAILARHGHKVLLLEKERFPRFHVGESLLPAAWDLWDRLGVTAEIEDSNYVVKQGVNFGMFSEDQVTLLTAEYPEYFQRPYTYHVERAHFDELLLKNAERSGARVCQEWTVADVIMEEGRAVGVMAGANGEQPREIRARAVVDATGRNCLLARKLGLRKPDPVLNKISHFAHFTGAYRKLNDDPQFDESTMTDIHTIDGGWIWYIPLRDDVVSVGVVLDAKYAGHLKGPQARFDHAIADCPLVAEWMSGARQTTEMHTISNISYLNDSFVGDGYAMIGDASMFVDPIFSAGVTLAIRGGVFAADAIHDGIVNDDLSAARLRVYEDKIRLPMDRIFKMIRNWYGVLEKKDKRNNIFIRSQRIPLLRKRLIVLLSGGYDKVDLDAILRAAAQNEPGQAEGRMSLSTSID